jgi:ATP-dependent Clp endopeptidase proteolytic subunit ClpP
MHRPLNRQPHNSRPLNFQRPSQAQIGRWYEIKNLATDTVEVSIFDEIGYWGVTASDFVKDLQGVSAKNITLHINSPGGDVFDGLAILNSLRQHPATVNVIIDGLAASAASFIAMAGDSVVIAPNAMVMIHEASGLVMGNSQDMTEMAALLDKTSANIASVYAQRAGGDVESWRQAMRTETWYSDQEAVDAGLADQILGADSPTARSAAKPQAVVQPVVANASEPVSPQVDNDVVTDSGATATTFAIDPDQLRRWIEEGIA